MTVYALDLDQVNRAIRETLVKHVLPAVESESARSELHAVIEMLDNLESRLAWNPARLTETISASRNLATALGRNGAADPSASADGFDVLCASRRVIGDALASAYMNGSDPAIVHAVAAFTAESVEAEISQGLLPGLPARDEIRPASARAEAPSHGRER